MNFIVTVRTGALTGTAYPPDDLSPFYLLPYSYLNPEHMAVKGAVAITVIDDDMIAVTVAGIAGYLHRAVGGSIDRRSLRGREIQARMKFGRLIYGVDTIPEAGGYTAEILITHRLDGRGAGQELFFILDKTVYLYI